MIQDELSQLIDRAVVAVGGKPGIVTVDVPTQKEFGDYATGVALRLTRDLKKTPLQIAEEIAKNIPAHPLIDKITVVPPGFINVWIGKEELLKSAARAAKGEYDFTPHHFGGEKKVMVEFAHPNTHKLFHIGHLRNITTGETIVRLLEASGNKVIRSNYQGDVGLHIAKTLYMIRKEGTDLSSLKTIQEKIAFLGKAYAKGQQAYDEDEKAKAEIHAVNKMIYDRDPGIKPLWEETVKWSIQYFEEMYKRVYSHFDRCFFESEMDKRGIEIVNDLLKKGILEKSEGAVIFNGKQYGVDTRVFVNSLGFPTYEGKELALAEKEFSEFGVLDKDIHVVTPEQTSFFKVTFKVEELIDGKYKDKQYHLAYNWVKLKHGKMSSRTGNIIEGAWLIDEAKKRLLEKFKLDEATAETLAVASVKYSFLKVSTQMEIYFDFDESISLEGNSAPYLVYTFVRTRSIRQKAGDTGASASGTEYNEDEMQLLRKLYRFPQVVHEAAKKLSPNLVTTYLFELAQDYNLFYQKNPILKAEGDTRATRLLLTEAVGSTLKKGLDLLGIKTVDKM